MKLFSWSLQLNGFPMKEAKRIFNRTKNIEDADFESYIETKKQIILDFHLKHNSFYKNLLKNKTSYHWCDLPVLNKFNLQQPIENRLSKGYSLKKQYSNKTSGSSGTPFSFAKDKLTHALTWSEFIDRYNWYNINLDHSYQARFYGIPLNHLDYYKERFKDWLGNRYRFSVFDLSADEMQKNLDLFKHKKFEYINGYTSVIVQFAKFLEKKQIILKTICPSLKCCIVTSEMLYESDKMLLEKQFNVPIINEYGCAEVGLIAFKNKANEWQVNSENLLIEILDKDNQPLPYGQEGKIVITSFYNKAHPFIRYELGDIGVLDEKSTPKKPILKRLLGRTSDLIQLPSGKTSAGLTFYYVTKTVMENQANVKEFVITQTKVNTFKITYVSETKISNLLKQNVFKAIEKYLEKGLVILFEKVDVLKRSKSGKLKQFTSLLG